MGNCFLYTFYTFPSNFIIAPNVIIEYLFIGIVNNELAYDASLFFTGVYVAFEFAKKFGSR